MTWFTLPPPQAGHKAAFLDSRSAATWLAGQPQANAPVMLGELLAQLRAFNSCRVPPDERFKTLTVLRNALFAVTGECQRRYETKPLPLLPAETSLRDAVCALWRACTISHLYCLRACLEGDVSIAPYAAKVAHRTLCCLRMEQLSGYLGGLSPDDEFWRNLHAILVSAETLGVARDLVEDRLLGETKESTASGQYAMALLLELARPFTLSRTQFAAVTRWLARWREQARILVEPDNSPKSCCIPLDLSLDRPFADSRCAARLARWLSIGPVLRKIGQRLESLNAGESPENLKLGSTLSAEACTELLTELAAHLKAPPRPPVGGEDGTEIRVASGLENLYRAIGGTGLSDTSARPTSFGNQLNTEQLAVFGHVVRQDEKAASFETWRMASEDHDGVHLFRPAGAGEARLALKSLLVLQAVPDAPFVLAVVRGVSSCADGSLRIVARVFDGEPQPVLVEARDKANGAPSRHPAVILPIVQGMELASIFIPVGIASRSVVTRFLDPRASASLAIRLDESIDRGSDHERWRLGDAVV